jgi:hypothetical protein
VKETTQADLDAMKQAYGRAVADGLPFVAIGYSLMPLAQARHLITNTERELRIKEK